MKKRMLLLMTAGVLLMPLAIPLSSSAIANLNHAHSDNSQKSAENFSLRFLARASNFLLVSNDNLLAKKKPLCKISQVEIEPILQNLKILIDQKIKILSSDQKRKIVQDSSQCDSECTCDIYALATEVNEKKSQSITAENRQFCASKFVSFCSSHLLEILRPTAK